MMRRHLSQEHLQLQRASLRRANDLYDDVYLQTWTRGSSQRYWTVVHQGRTVRSTAPDCAVDAHLAPIHRRQRSRLDAEAVKLTTQPLASRRWRTPACGWNALAGRKYMKGCGGISLGT